MPAGGACAAIFCTGMPLSKPNVVRNASCRSTSRGMAARNAPIARGPRMWNTAAMLYARHSGFMACKNHNCRCAADIGAMSKDSIQCAVAGFSEPIADIPDTPLKPRPAVHFDGASGEIIALNDELEREPDLARRSKPPQRH